MKLSKVVLWLVLALVALVVLSAVVSAVFAAVAFLWWVLRTAVLLGILGALAYGGYKLYGLLSDDNPSVPSQTRAESTYSQPQSGVDDLQKRYAQGELDEMELERQLERELSDDDLDSIDRELQRERS